MAITTEFLPYEANATALAIMKEFIYSYIDSSTLDVLDEFPVLDENFILYKPILVLEEMPGSKKFAGMGKNINNIDKGQFKNISFYASWIISNDCGGGTRLRQLADTLEYVFLIHADELAVAGLKKAVCSSLAIIPKTNYSPFWGGRNLLTARVLLRY